MSGHLSVWVLAFCALVCLPLHAEAAFGTADMSKVVAKGIKRIRKQALSIVNNAAEQGIKTQAVPTCDACAGCSTSCGGSNSRCYFGLCNSSSAGLCYAPQYSNTCGSSCFGDDDCGSYTINNYEQNLDCGGPDGSEQCTAQVYVGCACSSDAECNRGVCSGGTCLSELSTGDQCTSGGQCASGTCTSGTCAPVASGQPCTVRNSGVQPCGTGQWCDTSSNSASAFAKFPITGTCANKVSSGGSCNVWHAIYDGCPAGQVCDLVPFDTSFTSLSQWTGTCRNLWAGAAGSTCSRGALSSEVCQYGTYCHPSNGQCTAQALNSPCSSETGCGFTTQRQLRCGCGTNSSSAVCSGTKDFTVSSSVLDAATNFTTCLTNNNLDTFRASFSLGAPQDLTTRVAVKECWQQYLELQCKLYQASTGATLPPGVNCSAVTVDLSAFRGALCHRPCTVSPAAAVGVPSFALLWVSIVLVMLGLYRS